uniref:Uncharacterized protein n=1 Tax=Arundo donax TaxID=35708 RepID=A0A0A9DHW6_ARUDO
MNVGDGIESRSEEDIERPEVSVSARRQAGNLPQPRSKSAPAQGRVYCFLR